MISKSTSILFFLFFPVFIFAQYSSYERGYSKGWQEGYCYENKEIACIPPLSPQPPIPSIEESSDSFKDGYLKGFQHGLAEPNSSGYASTDEKSRYKYPEEVYKPDINQLALQVLVNRSKRNSYTGKKEWVISQAYPLWKKIERKKMKNYKERRGNDRRYSRKLKNKEVLKLSNLNNGWYKSYAEIPTSAGDKKGKFMVERFVNVYNGQLINYIGSNNAIFKVGHYKEKGNGIEVSIENPDGTISSPVNVKIYDSEPTEELPEFFELQNVLFYVTSDNGGGKIRVHIKQKNGGQSGTIDKILGGTPECNRSNGVAKMSLTPGKYEYYAYNDLSFWKGEIEVGYRCIKWHLSM